MQCDGCKTLSFKSLTSIFSQIFCRLRVLISIMQDTYLDVNCVKAIHAWKQEEIFEGNPEFSESDQPNSNVHSKILSPFKSQRPSRLRRRICRSRSNHQHQHNKSSYRRGCDGKVRQVRTESSDTEGFGFSSESGSVGKGDAMSNYPYGIDSWQQQNKHHPFAKRIRSFKSTSSIQSSGNWSMKTDSAVDFISKITSSRSLTNEKKLQFVSDVLLAMEDDDENDETGMYNDNYKTLSKKLCTPRSCDGTPAGTVSELTGRLCKSLDNIMGFDIRHDQRSLASNPGTKSLSNINIVDSEGELWRKIESRSPSMKSVHLDDKEFSSNSDESTEDREEIDDSAPLEFLQRNKPMRQNIRRKRYVLRFFP